ncbi:thiamine phosphate synthase [Oceaniglobus ichthyenteri]|uniref:thiamine phosphate synthase n=1 Tax=Oceaniglobus ichthyenteri TaxID=2136177 RepID=UPI000D362D89|nr:thiamine phosphate synthase [Oceaniglobus ichthyenteri]
MAQSERPQIYLITPPTLDINTFPDQLAQVLDAVDVACVRLHLASRDEDLIARTADALRGVVHDRDVAIVIQDHLLLVERLGLDGVHLVEGARNLRKVRKDLGADAIIGAYCAASRHDGMSAGESGADYVSFGPVTPTPLGDGTIAEPDLFAWWSEMIEVPVVAEGGLDDGTISALAPVTDFFGIGDEIWADDAPVDKLKHYINLMS